MGSSREARRAQPSAPSGKPDQLHMRGLFSIIFHLAPSSRLGFDLASTLLRVAVSGLRALVTAVQTNARAFADHLKCDDDRGKAARTMTEKCLVKQDLPVPSGKTKRQSKHKLAIRIRAGT